MDKEIKQLVDRYNAGKSTTEDVGRIERYLENGLVDIKDLESLTFTHDKFMSLDSPEPSEEMSYKFYESLHQEIEAKSRFSFAAWFKSSWQVQPGFQWAYSIVILLAGLAGGYMLSNNSNGTSEIKELSAEVTQMKEMMMLNLLEKESTSDRLKAVNLTSELPDASRKVTAALLKTLNNDENVNVRLATIEALYPYAGIASVRQGLIRSISKQESPLVQVALAELMVALQEKRSVEELELLLNNEETPFEVKERIKESIKVLI